MNKKKRSKPSGPAIFMYAVIAVAVLIASACFTLYYGNFLKSEVILWIGVSFFTVMYHFWMRIIMGNVSKLFTVNYKQRWFKERKFEKKLYKILRVRKWKEKVLTYNPDHFSSKLHSYEEIANTMSKSEIDHWINEIIAFSTVAFAFVWGEAWIFIITAFAAMAFDAQFIIVQRYNRPIVLQTAKRAKRRKIK